MGWTYTWNDLPVYDNQGKEIIWTITEKAISGYTADVTVKGDYFILINYVVKPTLPQTGMLWWPVPVLAAAGMMFIFIGALMRRRRDDA